MSCCAPACAVPTCIPACKPPVCYPVGGLGSLASHGVGAYGLGHYGVGAYGWGPYGISSAGGSVSAASLGLAPGASVSCLNQMPSSEVLIQPAPVAVVLPGAILAATCEPVRVGGYTACAAGAPAAVSSKLRYFPCSPCGPCR